MARGTLLVVILLLAGLAPASTAQETREPSLTDAAGDAVWYRSSDAQGQGWRGCALVGSTTQRVCDQTQQAPPVPTAGGAPAPPVLDIIAGDIRVEGTMVVAELSLASLTDPVAAHGQGDELALYNLCWQVGDVPCRDGVGVGFYRVNATTQLDVFFYRGDERCARVTQCYFEPEIEVVPGTPGTLRWTLPHAALAPDTPALVALQADTRAAPIAPVGYGYAIGAGEQETRGSTPGLTGSGADHAAGRETPLGPPPSWDPARDRVSSRTDAVGDGPAADRLDLDVLSVTLLEDERALTISTTIARVDEVPLDHVLMVDLLLTTGAYVTAGYTASQGARATYSGLCDPACSPKTAVALTRPAEVDVVAGAPGYVNVTFYRPDLGAPGRGDTFNQLFIAALLPEAVVDEEATVLGVQRVDGFRGDHIWDMSPWWFTLGPDRTSARQEDDVLVGDAVGDQRGGASLAALTTELGAFDIVSIRATGVAPGVFRIELGIHDLANVQPPPGYSAVFYGVAFSTEQGPIMVGYYDEPESDKREFFCAPDTSIIARPATDPQSVIWTPIQGMLSLVRDRSQQVAGGATPGSIVFLVPATCFGLTPEADLAGDALAAATFLFPPQGGMELVDHAQSDGPIVVAAAATPVPPFYAQPFGIGNFWDITGIVTAGLVALVGAIAIRRKQGALRRYLHEIEHVLREHAGNARAREAALHSIQERVKADLLRNKIAESHFVIVERRLDQHLAKVRVQALGDVFGDIPHRLLVTLQDLLRDGTMDQEDWRLFRTQLAAEPHLNSDARAGIERRVEAWVREHAASSPP